MSRIIYLFLFLVVPGGAFSQQKIKDGIYIIDETAGSGNSISQPGRYAILFNPALIAEDPETYAPITIITGDYFSFEQAGEPLIQNHKEKALLLYQLTDNAREKSQNFTARNIAKNIVVVVNNEALAVYKITAPVTGRLVKIVQCNRQVCNQLLGKLKA